MRNKLGLFTAKEGDLELIQAFLDILHKYDIDYTLSFCYLSGIKSNGVEDLFKGNKEFASWQLQYEKRLKVESTSKEERLNKMQKSNPIFIPRNHLVENIIQAAVENNDFSKMEEFIEVLKRPFDDRSQFADYAKPPKPNEIVAHTFCGT
jgi:uncharacterized protein YdiU (UPF0061 family)